MIRDYLTRSHVLDAFERMDRTVTLGPVQVLDALPVYTLPKRGYAFMERGEIYAIGGILPVWEGVGEIWLIPTRLAKTKPVSLARHIKLGLLDMEKSLELRRLQAVVRCGFDRGHDLVKFLGFQSEGVMRKYGPDGEDYERYAKWQTSYHS